MRFKTQKKALTSFLRFKDSLILTNSDHDRYFLLRLSIISYVKPIHNKSERFCVHREEKHPSDSRKYIFLCRHLSANDDITNSIADLGFRAHRYSFHLGTEEFTKSSQNFSLASHFRFSQYQHDNDG